VTAAAAPAAAATASRRPLEVGLILVILVVTLLVAVATRATLLRALAERAGWPAEEEALALPGATTLRIASLGHNELAADLIAARTNVYFGAQLAARGDYHWLERSLTTALDLDPRFHSLYRRGATMLVYTGKAFTVDAVLAADKLLARGTRAFPSDWEIWFQRGFNLLFELPKLAGEDDPRVAEWRQRGVESLRQATLLEGVPPWLPNLAAQMLTKQGGDALALRHLEQTYAVTSDEATRAEIRRKLDGLRGTALAAELAHQAAELQHLIEQRYPYAPESYSLIAGPRFDFDGRSADQSAHRQVRSEP
jgi:hypothetical protein